MTEPTRMIVLDDMDSRLTYSEGWQSVGGDDYNIQGAIPYKNSLHGTSADGANVRFSFKGNYARIMGTYELVDPTGASDPDWECTLDGGTVQRQPVDRSVGNRRKTLCAFLDLPEGDHTIGLIAKTRGRIILLDYVEYRSMSPVEDEVIWASSSDPDLQYSELWQLNGGDSYTTNEGSSATFKFTGTGVTLYAMYPPELPHANGEATYSVDGGPSTTFVIPGGDDTSMRNRRIFEVNGLNKQIHTIVITYTSRGDTTPLVISHFYIENGTNLLVPLSGSDAGSTMSTISATTTISGDRSSPAPLPSGDITPPDASTSKTPIGVIVGAVVGAIAAILLLLLLCFWCWRRRRINPIGEGVVTHAFIMEQERQGVPATPVTLSTTHTDPSIQAPSHHLAARSKRRLEYFVQGETSSASASPPPEPIYTYSRLQSSPAPPAPSGSVYHQDSGVRLPDIEAEAATEHPPMYTEL